MLLDGLRLRVAREPFSDELAFLLKERVLGERPSFGIAVEMRQEQEGEDGTQHEPTFRLSYDAAQQLMDNLWDCGLRPSEGTGSAGALAATQKHLEDMRKIAFDLLNGCTPKQSPTA